ncbi:MAG: hypothetical protein WCY72_08900 [Lysobacteraceae bacterium]|jgi:hypothetical protein
MAINASQLRGLIKETLEQAKLVSSLDAAVELCMMTIAVESNAGTYLRQLGKGPALGIAQMEPATFNDIMNRWILTRSDEFKNRVANFINQYVGYHVGPEAMVYNLKYAILLMRLKYMTISAPLPKATDVQGLAEYWKKYYNTYLGKGAVAEAVNSYKKYC